MLLYNMELEAARNGRLLRGKPLGCDSFVYGSNVNRNTDRYGNEALVLVNMADFTMVAIIPSSLERLYDITAEGTYLYEPYGF